MSEQIDIVWDAIDAQKADELLTAKAKALLFGYDRADRLDKVRRLWRSVEVRRRSERTGAIQ